MITPVYPNNILFKFITRRCGLPASSAIPSVYTIAQSPSQNGVGIGTMELTCSALALFSPSTSLTVPTNNTVLNQLVQQWSLDYLNWFQVQFDEVLPGINAVVPNGIIQVIEFSYDNNKCFTRISSFPSLMQPDRLAHQITTLESDCPDTSDSNSADPCIKVYGPPAQGQTSDTTTIDEFLICFQDGRLVETFLQTVIYDCACGSSSSSSSSCFLTICATNCDTGNVVSGAVITVTGAVPPSGFTPSGGCIQFLIPSPGTYPVSASATGFVTSNLSLPITCNEIFTIRLISTNSPLCQDINIFGCNAFAGGALAGFGTLTVGGNTFTMPEDGGPLSACISLTSGTYPWTASGPDFQDMTGMVTVPGPCSPGTGLPETIVLTPDSGFHCATCQGFGVDVGGILVPSFSGFVYPETLTLNDSVYGGTTLTYDVPTSTWIGTLNVMVPACVGAGCAAGMSTLTYTWNGCLSITYSTVNGICPGVGGGNRGVGTSPVIGAIPFPLMAQYSAPQTCCVFGPDCPGPIPPYSTAPLFTVTT